MHEESDAQLLREYAEEGNEAAFRELVNRHTDLVYSAAIRQVLSPDLARDVAQNVFTDLARKARSLVQTQARGPSLLGWLYRGTRFAALNLLRDQRRRQARERQAMQHFDPASHNPTDWDRVQPLLDEVMSDLSDEDREAVLLRFFKNRDFRAVGESLGVSDDAAQKRVGRALDKLRAAFARRGVSTAVVALSAVVSANAVQIAPAGLASALSTTALAGTTLTAAATATVTKAIAMTTMQKTLIAATITVLAGAGLYEAHQASRLREEAEMLRQQQATLTEQIAQFKSDNESLSNRIARTSRSSLSTERLRELLKLRGEVGTLRRSQRELEQAVVAAQSKAPRPGGQPASGVPPQPRALAPFQVQLVLDEPGDDTEPMTNNASGAGGEALQVQKTPLLDHTAIRSATVTKNPSSGAPQIDVEFNEEGKELFAAITKENVNKRLAIVLNGQLYSAPVIREQVSGGKAQITGRFTEEEARELAARINDAVRGQ